jgi:hypothetical protein
VVSASTARRATVARRPAECRPVRWRRRGVPRSFPGRRRGPGRAAARR